MTSEPSSRFGSAQAQPRCAQLDQTLLRQPELCMSWSGVMPKCAMIVPTTSEASRDLDQCPQKPWNIRASSPRCAGR